MLGSVPLSTMLQPVAVVHCFVCSFAFIPSPFSVALTVPMPGTLHFLTTIFSVLNAIQIHAQQVGERKCSWYAKTRRSNSIFLSLSFFVHFEWHTHTGKGCLWTGNNNIFVLLLSQRWKMHSMEVRKK